MKKLLGILVILFFTSCTGMMNKNPIHTTGIYSGKYHELMNYAADENLQQMENIVKENQLQLNYADSAEGVSLLNWCIFNNKPKSFEKLLELGADPNWQDTGAKFAPAVTEAAQAIPTDKFLTAALQHNANPNCRSRKMPGSQNQAPLQAAVFSGELERVKLLVGKGADINYDADTSYNWLPLTDAVILRYLDIAKYLLENGADYRLVRFKRDNGEVVDIWGLLNGYNAKDNTEKQKQKDEILAILQHYKK